MVWQPATIARVVVPLVWLGCGGGGKPPVAPKPEPSAAVKPQPPPPETEEDRERSRHAEALKIVPDKSPCLPAALRNANAPRLELAAIGSAAVVCAIDQQRTRLLGPIACWSVSVSGPSPGALTYQDATPLPGRGLAVLLDDRCARGFCLPQDAKVPADGVALMTWNLESTKVAVLVGDDLHVFNAQTKAHETSFSIRGDKGVTGDPAEIDWNGESIFVQANDGAASPVFVFKPEGVPVGPIEAFGGGKDKAVLSTRNGSFLLLKPELVAISEQGLTTLTTYETGTGKRAKFVRKLPAPTCKKDELDAVWRDPNAQVRRECAIALRHNSSPEAAMLWAELAMQYDGMDRWYLEALGIGADGQWDKFFDAWLTKAGDRWNSPAGREIIWRSRSSKSPALLVKIIQDPIQRPTAIIVEPVGTEMVQVAKAAVAAGIGWGILNRDPDYIAELARSDRAPAFAVTTNQEEVGRIQGKQLTTLVTEGNVLYIEGPFSSSVSKLRTKGMLSTKPIGVELKMLKGDWTEHSAHQAVKSWLSLSTSRQLNVRMVMCQNDAMAMGARKALVDLTEKDRERWLKIPFTGCDGVTRTGQEWVRRGMLNATVIVPPATGLAIDIFVKAAKMGSKPPERTMVAPISFPPVEELVARHAQDATVAPLKS